MHEWRRQVQQIVDAIDESIANRDDEALTLRASAERLGYSEFHAARKFKEISVMPCATTCGGAGWRSHVRNAALLHSY